MERLQFISQEKNNMTHLQGISNSCKAGVKWIQLRLKNKSDEELLYIAKEAKKICDSYGAKLIINDYPHIAKQISASGVHLGKEDMPVSEARKITGSNCIIGGTANTFDDIEKHFKDGANYVGLGPYKFTTTKKNLSTILGADGIRDILNKCKERKISIPVIAIGGIELNDISSLIQTGVYGIAVSGLIASSQNVNETVKQINYSIQQQNPSILC